MLPTAKEDSNPFERQGPDGGLMGAAFTALLLVVGAGPEGMLRGFSSPFHERLSQEGRTLEAPVHPGCVAAAFRHRRDARVLLALIGSGVAVAWCTESDEETRGKD